MKERAMYLVEERGVQRSVELEGLAGWLLSLLRGNSLFAATNKRKERRHMRVVETLPMGPKRHLYLVSCDGERFLVGGGSDSVQTITRVRPEPAGLSLVRGGEELR